MDLNPSENTSLAVEQRNRCKQPAAGRCEPGFPCTSGLTEPGCSFRQAVKGRFFRVGFGSVSDVPNSTEYK